MIILITGTNLSASELPNGSFMDYQIETSKMALKLKTVGKKDECIKIFIAESMRTDFTITDEIAGKIVYFSDDADLINKLSNDSGSTYSDPFSDVNPVKNISDPFSDDFDEVKENVSDENNNSVALLGEMKDVNPIVVNLEKSELFENENNEKELELIESKVPEENVKEDNKLIVNLEKSEETDSAKEENKLPIDMEKLDEVDNVTEENKVTVNLEKVEEIDNIKNNEVSVELNDENDKNDDIKNSLSLKMNQNSVESMIPEVDIEEVSSELSDSFLQIPNLGDDTDSLREQLKTKDRIIAQKDGMIAELKQKMEQTYKTQEIELADVKQMWEQKLAEAQGIIDELQNHSALASIDEETMNFMKFIRYAQSSKAVVKEGLSQVEMGNLPKLHSKYTLIASGSGDSIYSMLTQVKSHIDKVRNCLVIDFSNDNFLSVRYGIKSNLTNTVGLFRTDINPTSLIVNTNGGKLIPSTNYNDIALLNVDWGKMLQKIDYLANGLPVLLVFGSINSFSVRYTVSKLATIMKLFVFSKCSPFLLSALYTDIRFIPKERVNIVAVEYIDVVKAVLTELSKSYNVIATNSDVDWNKLEK